MSTRCQIGFYYDENTPLNAPDALIYRHCDGYPDTKHGVPATVIPHLRTFIERRGFHDPEYCAAYVIARMMEGVMGHGVSMSLYGDIEYYYAVYSALLVVYTVKQGYATMKEIERHIY